MSSKQPTLFITGAGGFVGQQLVDYFADKGWNVVGLVRDPKKYKKTPKNVRYEQFDLTKPFDNKLFKGVDYLVHTAYIKADRNNPDAFNANLEGTKAMLTAARRNGVRKSLFMSSMSAHNQAKSVYGRQKLAIEELFNAPNDVILRSGLIVGNGGIVRQMAGFLKTKRMVPLVDGGRQPLQIISVSNLVQVIEKVLESKLHGRFVVAHPKVYEYKELYKAMGDQLGVKLLFVPVPFIALLGVMRTIAFLRLPLAVNEDNLWGLKMLRSADNAADIKKIGVKLDTLQEALARPGVMDV